MLTQVLSGNTKASCVCYESENLGAWSGVVKGAKPLGLPVSTHLETHSALCGYRQFRQFRNFEKFLLNFDTNSENSSSDR